MTSALYKVEGAGNDFLLGVGAWATRLDADPELVIRLCDRRRGIGADGTLALRALAANRVQVGYRNADGGSSAFCANGTRCAARAAVDLLDRETTLVVETGWADIPAHVDGSEVTLDLPAPPGPPQRPAIMVGGPLRDLRVLEVGVPHLIGATSGLAELDLPTIAPPLRSHEALGPEGANVDFYEIGDDGTIFLRTWERGVEGETLSCGSGMVATALVVMANNAVSRVELVPLSGDRLVVEALGEPPVCATRLTGPTRIVAHIDPSEELLGTG